jgi:hypothetical protein
MKKLILSGLSAAALVFGAFSAGAEMLETEQVVPLEIHLQTSIETTALTPAINHSFEGQGPMPVTVEFGVNANVPTVRMHVCATELHFQEDPSGVTPLPLNTAKGVEIEVSGATAEGGTTARFNSETEVIDSFTAYKTDEVVFVSDDPHSFQHNVFVEVEWLNQAAGQPSGVYEGRVKLVTLVEPNE